VTSVANQVRAAIAQNLRHARQTRGLSMRDLAERAGVSKALLSQLERGVANPTVEVLAGIAASLELSFTDLSRAPLYEPQVLRRLVPNADGLPSARTLFGSTEGRRFEIYESVFTPEHVHDSAPHGRASEECAYVITGAVTLEIAAWKVQLRSGDAVRFSAEAEHSYRTGQRATRLLTLVSMPTD
jgi:XRE family transcriptional regulator, regulator of sulfur utilization